MNADRVTCSEKIATRLKTDPDVEKIICTYQNRVCAVALVCKHDESLFAFDEMYNHPEKEIPSLELLSLVRDETKGAGEAIIRFSFPEGCRSRAFMSRSRPEASRIF